MRRIGHISTSGPVLTQNLSLPWVFSVWLIILVTLSPIFRWLWSKERHLLCVSAADAHNRPYFYSRYNHLKMYGLFSIQLGLRQDLCVFWVKTAFVMVNSKFGACKVWVILFDKTTKGTSLCHSASTEPLNVTFVAQRVAQKPKQASHALWGSAGLKMLIHANFLRRATLTHKTDQTDLVFGVLSGFISGSVHARLQVCMQRLRFVPPWLTSIHTHIDTNTAFWPAYMNI